VNLAQHAARDGHPERPAHFGRPGQSGLGPDASLPVVAQIGRQFRQRPEAVGFASSMAPSAAQPDALFQERASCRKVAAQAGHKAKEEQREPPSPVLPTSCQGARASCPSRSTVA